MKTKGGRYFWDGVFAALRNAFAAATSAAGHSIQQALRQKTIDHWTAKYPGSKHFNQTNISLGDTTRGSQTTTSGIDIDADGAARAYEPKNILPRRARMLAIPIHREAFGVKPRQMKGLFHVKGKDALFIKRGSGLTAMYALKRGVYQNKDDGIMPEDRTFAREIGNRWMEDLDRETGAAISRI